MMNLSALTLECMQTADVDEVEAIEQSVFSHPWSRGNFVDSLAAAYDAMVVRLADGTLGGYFVQMPVVDEMHLLTIAVQARFQGQGLGRWLLEQAIHRAKLKQMQAISLEVRASNQRALAVYDAAGFVLAGRRKNYYKTGQGQREDALILRFELA